MNIATSKTNFIKCEANLYSWLLDTRETLYQKRSLSYCDRTRREQSLLLG